MIARRLLTPAIAAVAVATLALASPACSTFSEDAPPATGGDAGPAASEGGGCGDVSVDHDNCGVCGRVCGAVERCVAGDCKPGCPDGIVYVSKYGSDANTGCSRTAPKATIGAAIGYVVASQFVAHEVHVCKGGYPEALTLDYPVSLRGGYSCQTWERTPKFGFGGFDADGAATGFDGVNETSVDGVAEPVPLTVKGAIDNATVVDGLTFRAAGAVALAIEGDASPTIRDDDVIGSNRDESVAPYGSIGLRVSVAAAPLVTKNRIRGGGGKSDMVGSAAIVITSSSGPRVEGNEIVAGTGVGARGAVGVHLSGPGTAPISIVSNGISSGGSVATTNVAAALGVYVQRDGVDVVGNRIDGGVVTCASSCYAAGVYVDAPKAVVRDNRIVGSAASVNASFDSHGVIASGVKALVANNFVLVQPGRSPTGIALGAADIRVIHNTVVAAGTVSGGAPLGISAANHLGHRVERNIVIARDPSSVIPLVVGSCPNATVSGSVIDNVIITEGTLSGTVFSGGCGYDLAPTAALLESKATARGYTASGNVAVRTSCAGGDVQCKQLVCPSNDCAPVVLADWDAASLGAKTVLGPGLRLGSRAPCLATQRSGQVDLDVTKDAFGADRTPKTSAGAHEYDGSCAN